MYSTVLYLPAREERFGVNGPWTRPSRSNAAQDDVRRDRTPLECRAS